MDPVSLTTRLEMDADGQALLYVEGDIDLASSDALREALANALAQSASVVVDVDGVAFIDSSGLNAIVWGHREAEKAGGSLHLRRPSPMLRRLLDITALDSLLLTDGGQPESASADS